MPSWFTSGHSRSRPGRPPSSIRWRVRRTTGPCSGRPSRAWTSACPRASRSFRAREGTNTFNGEPSPLEEALAELRAVHPRRRLPGRRHAGPTAPTAHRDCGRRPDALVPPAPRHFRRRPRSSTPGRGRSPVAAARHGVVRQPPPICGAWRHGTRTHVPFRRAAEQGAGRLRRSWTEQARRAEDLGYSTLLMPDHFGDQLAPVPPWPRWRPPPPRCAWVRWSSATTTATLRAGQGGGHLDVLSGGRFEMSLGAGWMRTDYEEAGLAYDHRPCAWSASKRR